MARKPKNELQPDDQSQRKLRELFNLYKQELGVSNIELAEGLGVSRPKLIKFMNHQDEELSIRHRHLISLYEALSKPEQAAKFKGEILGKRIALGRRGPDELLEAAGFLPRENKAIRITKERFAQIAQVVTLLDSELLPFEEMVVLVQELLTSISSRLQLGSTSKDSPDSKRSTAQQDSDLAEQLISIQQYLREHKVAGLRFIGEVEKKLNQSGVNLKQEGKTDFSEQEAIGLYRSIATKELMKDEEPPIRIRVEKVEFQTISLTLISKKDYQEIYEELRDLGNKAEQELNARINIPVIKASVTCSFGLESDEELPKYLTWGYASCSTLLANAISACALQIGYCEEVAEILVTCRTLGKTVDSLVETIVVLGQKYQGIWVDRDLVKSVLQALVNAGKYWLGSQDLKKEFSLLQYAKICGKVSNLRERLSIARSSFHEFNFSDDTCNLDAYISIANDASELLEQLPKNQDAYFRHTLELYRFYFIAKRLQLRFENIRGNLNEANRLINEISEEFRKIDNNITVLKQLLQSQALFESEILLYSLSCSRNLFADSEGKRLYLESSQNSDTFASSQNLLANSDERNRWLVEKHNDIVKSLNPKVLYQDPGIDTYLALSEIYGNIARMDFYLSQTPEELERATESCLKASHYASRIGAKQRTSRWLALAGRVQVRLGNRSKSKQLLEFAREMAQIGISPYQDEKVQQALLSEVQILEGERLLMLEDNFAEALPHFLDSLKGAMYLSFTRRISDALYNIARCSKRLGSISFAESIDKKFENLSNLDEEERRKLNPSENTISRLSLELLIKLRHESSSSSWLDVKDQFLVAASSIWQTWHESSNPGAGTKHSISQAIEAESFLGRIASGELLNLNS
jgi:hypothetical protein